MNTKLVMTSSAILLGAIGVTCSFAPHEILNYAGIESIGFLPMAIQILGALYLGFAMLNWMSKGIIIGGIYARPLAMGNFIHFSIGTLTLVKSVKGIPEFKEMWILSAVYLLFAICFGWMIFHHPLPAKG